MKNLETSNPGSSKPIFSIRTCPGGWVNGWMAGLISSSLSIEVEVEAELGKIIYVIFCFSGS